MHKVKIWATMLHSNCLGTLTLLTTTSCGAKAIRIEIELHSKKGSPDYVNASNNVLGVVTSSIQISQQEEKLKSDCFEFGKVVHAMLI